ncbi:hypothetical protein HDG35_007574 [Paraburkholderia sp. JPY681]|nr:hypothetical protein [Paraburkholderia atlantica]
MKLRVRLNAMLSENPGTGKHQRRRRAINSEQSSRGTPPARTKCANFPRLGERGRRLDFKEMQRSIYSRGYRPA